MSTTDKAIDAASKLADPLLVVGALVTLALFRTGFLDGLEGEAASILTFGTITAAVGAGLRWAIERVRDRWRDQAVQDVGERVAGYMTDRLEKAARAMGWDGEPESALIWIEEMADPDADEPTRFLLPDGSYTNRMADALAAWYAAAPAEAREAAQRVDTQRKIAAMGDRP